MASRSAITNAAAETLGYQRWRQPDWYHAAMNLLGPLFDRHNTLFRVWLGSKDAETMHIVMPGGLPELLCVRQRMIGFAN